MDIKLKLQVDIFKEGDKFVAYSPALDLSTSGDSLEHAKKMFEESVSTFFEELEKDGTAKEVLLELGWKKGTDPANPWIPPHIISREVQAFQIPLR